MGTSIKKISIVFVAAVSLAAFGCTKKGANCGNAVDEGMEVQKAHLSGMDDAMKGKMKDVALSHCKDDKWSDDVLQCMSEAKADTDFKICQAKLTPEQEGSMQKSMKELMMSSSKRAPASGAGSVAAGSATAGSAATGSAAAAGSGNGSVLTEEQLQQLANEHKDD